MNNSSLISRLKNSLFFSQVLKYFVVGLTATIIDMGLLYLLTEFGHFWYMLSATFSFTAGAITSYSLNKIWTFQNKSKKIPQQFGVFLVITLIGISLNLLIIYFLTEFIHLWYMFSKIIATAIVFVWNFLGNKYVTFRVFR